MRQARAAIQISFVLRVALFRCSRSVSSEGISSESSEPQAERND
jgi:hypothetical protein